MKKKLILVCFGLLISQTTQASALYFYEIGTEDTALAGAGQAARAQDASTIVTNPAGMTRLPDHMFTGGVQAMDGDVSYSLNDDAGRKSPGDIMRFFLHAFGGKVKAEINFSVVLRKEIIKKKGQSTPKEGIPLFYYNVNHLLYRNIIIKRSCIGGIIDAAFLPC